jgi:hypothetical protein
MIVSLDIDGLLADFDMAMRNKFNLPFEYYQTWSVDRLNLLFHYVENDPEFWRTMPMLNGPERIKFKFDYYISAIPPNMKGARQDWLSNNGYPNVPLIVTDDKLQACRHLGIDLHVDDKESTVLQLNSNGINSLKYIPYYMKELPTPYDFHDFNILNILLP